MEKTEQTNSGLQIQESATSGAKIEFINIENIQKEEPDKNFAQSERIIQEGILNFVENEQINV